MAFLNSFLSMSTLDGPGVRCVAFLQGCPLRCAYCHNPDTWGISCGEKITAPALLQRVLRYKSYFGTTGGVTLSGGEALAQAEFVAEFFALCRRSGINTALDTAGSYLDDNVREALGFTDYCLLDIKMTTEEDYKNYTGGSLEKTLCFLAELDRQRVRTRIRQVIVPGVNDSPEQILRLKSLCADFSCVEKIELLPFRKLCVSKYEALGLPFPLKDVPEASPELIDRLEQLLKA